jgi:hypothetical protein
VYTKLYELPLHISDVFNVDSISEITYPAKAAIWQDVFDRNKANFAPNTLLIHPNRLYKLEALKLLVNHCNPEEVYFEGLEAYGDFWRYRDSVTFNSHIRSDSLVIEIADSCLPIQHQLGFIIDHCPNLDTAKLFVRSTAGLNIPFFVYPWDDSSLYLCFEPYQAPLPLAGITHVPDDQIKLSFSPNPFTEIINCQINSSLEGAARIFMLTELGDVVYSKDITLDHGENKFSLSPKPFTNGHYFVCLYFHDQVYCSKIVFLNSID